MKTDAIGYNWMQFRGQGYLAGITLQVFTSLYEFKA